MMLSRPLRVNCSDGRAQKGHLVFTNLCFGHSSVIMLSRLAFVENMSGVQTQTAAVV